MRQRVSRSLLKILAAFCGLGLAVCVVWIWQSMTAELGLPLKPGQSYDPLDVVETDLPGLLFGIWASLNLLIMLIVIGISLRRTAIRVVKARRLIPATVLALAWVLWTVVFPTTFYDSERADEWGYIFAGLITTRPFTEEYWLVVSLLLFLASGAMLYERQGK